MAQIIPYDGVGSHWRHVCTLLPQEQRLAVDEFAAVTVVHARGGGGPRGCLQVTVERGEGKKPLVTSFGGIPLKRERTVKLNDVRPIRAPAYNELIPRLLAECCELCEARTDLEVHHIRHLADLNQPGRRDKPVWIQLMARRKRKTLVLCRSCHVDVHAGRVSSPLRK